MFREDSPIGDDQRSPFAAVFLCPVGLTVDPLTTPREFTLALTIDSTVFLVDCRETLSDRLCRKYTGLIARCNLFLSLPNALRSSRDPLLNSRVRIFFAAFGFARLNKSNDSLDAKRDASFQKCFIERSLSSGNDIRCDD